MNELEKDLLEEEFEYKMMTIFDNKYHPDWYIFALDEEEDKEENWDMFKQYLHDVANDIHNPKYEGVFIRLLFRDFIYNNSLFEKEEEEK